MNSKRRLFWIKSILVFFVLALGVSGLTAIPLRFELNILNSIAGREQILRRLHRSYQVGFHAFIMPLKICIRITHSWDMDTTGWHLGIL